MVLTYLTPNRWIATVSFLNGPDVTFYMAELEELQSLIERGPNFYLIENICIKLNSDRDGYKECVQDALEQSDMPDWKAD